MVDGNAGQIIGGVVEQVATENNVAMATEVAGNAISLFIKLGTDAFALVQQNWMYGVAILVLMKALDLVIEHFDLPVPKGKIRWVILFIFTMFFSWAWLGFVEGLIG